MFVKYNSVLRGTVSDVTPLRNHFKMTCKGNSYPTTIHILSAAIIKLSKVQEACVVYRAPGGALPKSFWKKDDYGTCGGIEPAFLSTTTSKEEAMHYARRSPSKMIFEVRQGMVARGASISWLSQHPTEQEILLPPLTVLEVMAIRVEGTVIVAELRPSVPPPSIKSSWEAERQAWLDAAAGQEKRKAETEKRKRAQWQASMTDVRMKALELRALRAESSAAISVEQKEKAEQLQKLAQQKLNEAVSGEAKASAELQQTAEDLNMRLKTQLKQESTKHAAERAKMVKEAKLAADAAAQKAKDETYAKAQEVFAVEREQKEKEVKELTAQAALVIRRKELVAETDKLEVPKLVSKLRVALNDKDDMLVEVCCARMAKLLNDNVKARTKAAVCGGLHVLSAVMRSDRHHTNLNLLELCSSALSSITKANGLQHAAAEANCLKALAQSLSTMERHGLQAIEQITKQNEETRRIASDQGVRDEWLPNEGKSK